MRARLINGWIERIPLHVVAPVYDIIVMVFAGWLAWALRFGQMEVRDRYTLAISVMILLILILNSYGENYARWQSKRLGHLIFNLFLVWTAATLIISSMLYFLDFSSEYSRLWIVSTLWISFFLAVAGRIVARVWLARYRLSGSVRRKIFLVGPGPVLLATARHMRREQVAGYSIAGYQRMKGEPMQRELDHLARRVEATKADEVWICMPLNMGDTIKEITFTLRHLTADIRFFPELSDLPLLNHRVSEVVGLYSIDLSTSPMLGKARIAKRLEDFWIGLAICILIAPVCLLIALAIKLTSPGPVIFKQYRTGINGKRFKVYKFRSMRVHEEHDGQVTQAMKGDARITPIGAFLRKTSLDELPQFFNVLQGRMSIVGPRPHALAHNEHYKALVESYMKRHKVKPGITGWAQVSGFRGETDTLEKMQMRVKFDLWYIENWSLALDIKIIFLTFFKGFVGKNAY
ncbi:undecaprenyl-phosphate glucose phosphotransferase [Halotalea alkalilenta]|uniref:Undecaprenyl-phosphate glucose phosphotransferase n=1 Tax=Halotalea alkalilenta TaxID=376489 RepID=A0A172YGI8_9GAMM|nr:undecaprenyl-phosphate glucose phosphotransferase [Halotalea alkalilenta]ANF58400.1 undecaprenyl-phosphate glucose phosphotransferase [Halotalea alkalilenta]